MKEHHVKSIKNKVNTRGIKSLAIAGVALITIVGSQSIQMSPFQAFGGAVWADNGMHYIDDVEIAKRIEKINAPSETEITTMIAAATASCDQVPSGYCQKSPGIYAEKTLVSPAVAYVPAVPDKKIVSGYCTLCRDGTFSPSCAVGRGACSHHSGVSAYNVASYRTIIGNPAVEAKPAVYSYDPKTYQDSIAYVEPTDPNLNTIVKTAK